MPNIERVELPAAADGSAQWFTTHRRPTHGQAKAISQAYYEGLNGTNILGIETTVVRQLCPTAVVKGEDGRELPYGDDGEGIEAFPEDVVAAMYAEASKAIEDLFPQGNRAGRRQKAR